MILSWHVRKHNPARDLRPPTQSFKRFFDPSYAVPPYTAVFITVRLRWLFANTIGRTVDGESVPVPDQAPDGRTRQTDGAQP